MPDLPAPPPPPLNPKTLQPLTADDLAPIFPMGALRCGASVVMRQCRLRGGPVLWLRPTRGRTLPSPTAGLIEQEVSLQRYIDIPQEIRDVYKLWRWVQQHRDGRGTRQPGAVRDGGRAGRRACWLCGWQVEQ